jgi:hypothetical protein
MASYGWVKVVITTENRDRAGGHHTSDGYIGACNSNNMKACRKKANRKKQRRQLKQLEREAESFHYWDMHETHLELRKREEEEWAEELDQFYQEDDYDDSDLRNHCDDWASDYLDDWSSDYDSRDFEDDYNSDFDNEEIYSVGYLSRQGITRLDMNARIISEDDAGKSLGDLLQEALQRRA